MNFPFEKRALIGELKARDVGSPHYLAGFVATRRDHGGVQFIDLRDESGVLQLVVRPESPAFEQAKTLSTESCIGTTGTLKRRPPGTENKNLATGEWELEGETLWIFSKAHPLPFTLDDPQVDERVRLRYRSLDLRREPMQKALRFRSKAHQALRTFLTERSFVELETPNLLRSTPEGARDFLVPSRFFPGKFYALPQSPQLFKQVFMASGFERYFQIVRCFRDEDLRQDRQPEFTQLDLEMAHCSEEMVRKLVENLLVDLFEKLLGIRLPQPFPRLTLLQAKKRYGTDKPDLRAFELHELTSIFQSSKFQVFQQVVRKRGVILGFVWPKKGELSRSALDELTQRAQALGAKGLAWFAVRNKAIHSPVAKFLSDSEKNLLVQATGAKEGDLILTVADEEKTAQRILSSLGSELCKKESQEEFAFCWVTDFPLFEFSETEQKLTSCHNPFTLPLAEDLPLLEKEPEKVRSHAYDLVLNGVEVGGGSLRIHSPELQKQIFRILGFTEEAMEKSFGFFLQALSFGAPPHGGIALGLDRLYTLMLKAKSIREVISFPKTQSGTCLFSEAPFAVEEEQLKELHLQIKEELS